MGGQSIIFFEIPCDSETSQFSSRCRWPFLLAFIYQTFWPLFLRFSPSKSCRPQKKHEGRNILQKRWSWWAGRGLPRSRRLVGWALQWAKNSRSTPLATRRHQRWGLGGAWARAMGDTLAGEVPYMLGKKHPAPCSRRWNFEVGNIFVHFVKSVQWSCEGYADPLRNHYTCINLPPWVLNRHVSTWTCFDLFGRDPHAKPCPRIPAQACEETPWVGLRIPSWNPIWVSIVRNPIFGPRKFREGDLMLSRIWRLGTACRWRLCRGLGCR